MAFLIIKTKRSHESTLILFLFQMFCSALSIFNIINSVIYCCAKSNIGQGTHKHNQTNEKGIFFYAFSNMQQIL